MILEPESVTEDRLVCFPDNINVQLASTIGGLAIDPSNWGKLNLWAVGEEDGPTLFRGYGGRFFLIREPNGEIIATTNLWHLGEIKSDVHIDPSLVSTCLTDIKWQASDKKRVSHISGSLVRSYYTTGWRVLESTEVQRLLVRSFGYREADQLIA